LPAAPVSRLGCGYATVKVIAGKFLAVWSERPNRRIAAPDPAGPDPRFERRTGFRIPFVFANELPHR